MTVEMIKRVPAGMLTGIESVPGPVSMVKREPVGPPADTDIGRGHPPMVPVRVNPVVRAVRVLISSSVLSHVDVMELADGTVCTVAVRRPDAYPWRARHVRLRARSCDFDAVLGERVSFETTVRPVRGVKLVR